MAATGDRARARYAEGIVKTTLRIGDHVADGTLLGTVVAVIETGEFSADYTAASWAYLKVGVLVMTDEAGLIHYPDPARLTISN
jgi:predicted deacylase